jgi:hypothetical protein
MGVYTDKTAQNRFKIPSNLLGFMDVVLLYGGHQHV